MSYDMNDRPGLGPRLEKKTVNCMCGCHRTITVKLWPGTTRMPRRKSADCMRRDTEMFGDYWC